MLREWSDELGRQLAGKRARLVEPVDDDDERVARCTPAARLGEDAERTCRHVDSQLPRQLFRRGVHRHAASMELRMHAARTGIDRGRHRACSQDPSAFLGRRQTHDATDNRGLAAAGRTGDDEEARRAALHPRNDFAQHTLAAREETLRARAAAGRLAQVVDGLIDRGRHVQRIAHEPPGLSGRNRPRRVAHFLPVGKHRLNQVVAANEGTRRTPAILDLLRALRQQRPQRVRKRSAQRVFIGQARRQYTEPCSGLGCTTAKHGRRDVHDIEQRRAGVARVDDDEHLPRAGARRPFAEIGGFRHLHVFVRIVGTAHQTQRLIHADFAVTDPRHDQRAGFERVPAQRTLESVDEWSAAKVRDDGGIEPVPALQQVGEILRVLRRPLQRGESEVLPVGNRDKPRGCVRHYGVPAGSSTRNGLPTGGGPPGATLSTTAL